MEIMEHKLGEIFQYNDEGNIVTLQVLEDNTVECKGCFFNDPVHKECFKEGTITGWCVGRNDSNSVKFIQVTMEELYHPEAYTVIFNSEEAAKKAIDILGNELKILFE